MTAIALTYAQVAALEPDAENLSHAVELLGGEWTAPIDAAAARRAGVTFEDIICVASRLAQRDQDVARRMRLLAADCAAHVLHVFERQYPADHRPRNAIIAARQYARGDNDANAALDAAKAALDAAKAAKADYSAITAAIATAVADTAVAAVAAVADTAVAAYIAVDAANAEREWQFMRLCKWLSETEPEDWLLIQQQEAV